MSHIEGGIFWCFLSCGGKLWFPFDLLPGPQGTSHVASEKSDLCSSFQGHLGIPFIELQGNRASSRAEAGLSGSLSSSDRDLRVPIDFQQGHQDTFPFEA